MTRLQRTGASIALVVAAAASGVTGASAATVGASAPTTTAQPQTTRLDSNLIAVSSHPIESPRRFPSTASAAPAEDIPPFVAAANG